MKKVLMVLVIGLFLCVAVITAQGAKEEDMFPFKGISEWVGEEFIFLLRTRASQKYGYQSIFTNPKKPYNTIPYDKYAGKIIKVVDATSRSRVVGIWDIEFEVRDTGEKLYARALSEKVADLAYYQDLIRARNRFVGKILWSKTRQLLVFDITTEKISSISIKKWSPVEVVAIKTSFRDSAPLRFMLRTPSGDVGFNNVYMSGTNISEILRKHNWFFDEFLLEDPRITYSWSDKVWTAIENESVLIGMTKQQALMAWGKPNKINRTTTATGRTEQWVYRSSYLYFTNDKLTTIQN